MPQEFTGRSNRIEEFVLGNRRETGPERSLRETLAISHPATGWGPVDACVHPQQGKARHGRRGF